MKEDSRTASLNADFSKPVIVHTAAVDWQASPSPSVWRKRLDLTGEAESGRVTSIVRYDADSAFPEHPHPDGEEILVLEGVFSDQHGDYRAGAYLLNPEGFSHAPLSREGCVLFVKLRQYAGNGRRQIIVDTANAEWRRGPAAGVETITLYEEAGHPETMYLVRMSPGAVIAGHAQPGGEEILVLGGSAEDGRDRYRRGSWVRTPPGRRPALRSENGCTFYMKRGHLAW